MEPASPGEARLRLAQAAEAKSGALCGLVIALDHSLSASVLSMALPILSFLWAVLSDVFIGPAGGGTRGRVGGGLSRWMELRLPLLVAGSHLWEGVIRARFNTPFVSSWFSSLAWFTFGAGPGPAERRQDQIRTSSPSWERERCVL